MEIKKQTLVMKSGATYPITGETNRHYFCEGTQFRKGNPNIIEVQQLFVEPENAEEAHAESYTVSSTDDGKAEDRHFPSAREILDEIRHKV